MKKTLDKRLFNIDVFTPKETDVANIGQVTNGFIFETNSKVFRKGGLYDPLIFGQVGTTARMETFGYIDLVVPILHPLIYTTFLSLGSLYAGIAEKKKFAIFDNKKKDFVLSDNKHGHSGYTYLIDNIHKIQFDDKEGEERKLKIAMVKGYSGKDNQLTKWLVLPAGLREYEEDDNGRPQENEVNNLYRKLLGLTSMIKNININGEYSLVDSIRLKIQKVVVEIYEHFKTLIDGKKKFIEDKFAKRAVTYGTRNVITPMDNNITDLTKTDMAKLNTITVGLYQYAKAITPITVNKVMGIFSNRLFNTNTTSAYLVDPKTLKTILVDINIKKRDEWLSISGINDIMNKLAQPDVRAKPVMVDKYYIMLVHDQDNVITMLDHTDDIPEDMDKKYLRPITYTELFYIAIYDTCGKYPAFATRYPVVELGGIYPCKPYVKTTIKGRTVTVRYRGQEKEMKEYPIIGQKYVEAMSPHNTRLPRLGADFDGDSIEGLVYGSWSVSRVQRKINRGSLVSKNTKEKKMPCRNNVRTEYGLIDLANFPKGKLIKQTDRIEEYEVDQDIKVLTVWNGKKKWLKPISYSIHKNLQVNQVRTHRGNTVLCSNDHSLVTIDKNLNYTRFSAHVGMCIPKYTKDITEYVNPNNIKRAIKKNGVRLNLNKDRGYLIGCGIQNQHLPTWWSNTCKKFRWGLLSGLIDTNGTITKFVGYSTASRILAHEFIALCNSLGLTCGLTIHKRKNKKDVEYCLFISRYDNETLQDKLLLNNPYKHKALTELVTPSLVRYTPNVVEEKVLELRKFLWSKKEQLWASRLSDGLKKSKRYGYAPFVCRNTIMQIFKTYPELLKDTYWKKLYTILQDNEIEWEVITSVEPTILTEAYDLTIPPAYTFVMQNGIVVYDTMSLNVLFTKESIDEIDKFLGSKEAYLSSNGEILYSSSNDISELVTVTLTE